MPNHDKSVREEWMDFINNVNKERNALNLKPGERCFYRGHADSQWDLTPSLFREKKFAKNRRYIEEVLFHEFNARVKEHPGVNSSGWDILFMMRHHGVHTRILDWTEDFAVALFFALEEQITPEKADPRKSSSQTPDPCLWLLNPYSLNYNNWWGYRGLLAPKYLGSEPEGKDDSKFYDYSDYIDNDWPFDWEKPVAIRPVQRTQRIQAQNGFFTIHGDNEKALDKLSAKHLRKIHIPRNIHEMAKEFLELAGINLYRLFPEPDALAKTIWARYSAQDLKKPNKRKKQPAKKKRARRT